MADVPNDLKYTKDHEWARQQGDAIVVGITDYAQEPLGDVVYVELPKVGATDHRRQAASAWSSRPRPSPSSSRRSPGKVVKVNDALSAEPDAVNADPYGKGWMIEVEPSSKAEVDGADDRRRVRRLLEDPLGEHPPRQICPSYGGYARLQTFSSPRRSGRYRAAPFRLFSPEENAP